MIVSATATEATAALDQHVCEIVRWHFSADTGTPWWLDWASQAGWNPAAEVRGFADLLRFPHFQDDVLRYEPHERFIPRAYAGKPFKVFETGGTTGMPKQRISWEDHLIDYTEFSHGLDADYPETFPRGGHWLMLGPTGPRRLRLAIEHLANYRGGSCYHVDLDPRWVKRALAEGKADVARAYQDHVIDQAVELLKHRKIACLFTTPRLLESLGDRLNVPDAGVRGVFCGGTSMTPQVIRFLCEEVLEQRAALVPTYGNTLMGLAVARPVTAADGYALTYYAPQPRAVLRVVDPDQTDRVVDYGQWGRVELSTLTKEFFMPRFLERDEAVRREPHSRFAWDGVGDVRPFGFTTKPTIEGVY
jgi:hypothetical protein